MQPGAPLTAVNTSLPQVQPADSIQANQILEQEELQLMGRAPSRLQILDLLSCWSLGFSVGVAPQHQFTLTAGRCCTSSFKDVLVLGHLGVGNDLWYLEKFELELQH